MADKKKVDPEQAVLDIIAKYREPYREMGERLHKLILAANPDLTPKPYYGSAGYAKKGPVLVFFRVDDMMTLGLSEKANHTVEKGAKDKLMNSAWFLTELDKATEARITELVKKATG